MDKKIVIYSAPTCPYCNMVKDYLKEKGINYSDIDIAANPDAAKEIVQKSGQMGVPVIVISEGDKEEIIVGFDKEKINKNLGI